MAAPDPHLHIAALVFPEIDQIDLTGPFEVLSRLPDSTFHLLWKEATPVRDIKGLVLTPDMSIAEAPPLDLLVVPGGWGQEQLMEDEAILGFVRRHAAQGSYIFSVCTGALICGAAGVLRGVKCTTHWAAFHLLKYFGATPVEARVVIDGKHISAAGVTAGIDGALQVASLLRGRQFAEQVQLSIEYAPEPPFNSGTPQTAPAEILQAVQASYQAISEQRLATARRCAQRLGIEPV